MKSAFEHKPRLRLSEFIIEKTVRIPDGDLERLLCHPMDEQPFIAENAGLMYQDDAGVYHCILVTGTERTDGLLVESEGYGYARYASYVPETSALGCPALAEWNRKLSAAADLIVKTGTQQARSGSGRISYEELEQRTGLSLKGQDGLQEMLRDILLNDREEGIKLQMDDEGMCVVCRPGLVREETGNGLEKRNGPQAEPQKNLKELLLKGVPADTYLIHPQDVGWIPVGRITPGDLTSSAMQGWRDILEAKVTLIKQGAYGLEIGLAGVTAERLRKFDEFLAEIPFQSQGPEMRF